MYGGRAPQGELYNKICTYMYMYTYAIFLPLSFFVPIRLPSRLFDAFVVLFFANSFVNPILYAVRMPDFKRALVSLFRRQQRQVEIFPLGPL